VHSHLSLIFKSVYHRHKFILDRTNQLYRLDDQGSTTSTGRDFSVFPHIQTSLGANTVSSLMGTGSSFPMGKASRFGR
jgi:hypothetical protein